MNEINVLVKQQPGIISWNLEEVKAYLEDSLQVYRGMVYTDDTIKTAKTDVANLRKLAKAIEDKRKEIKNRCLEPYAVIEDQAKELVELIEKPIQAINEQVSDYERRRREKVKKEITEYWNEQSVAIPEDVRELAKEQIYDVRWENASSSKKSWKEAIDAGVKRITEEIATIKEYGSEFEDDAMAEYKKELSLQKAVKKMFELDAQKKRILEMEERKKAQAEAASRAAAEPQPKPEPQPVEQPKPEPAKTHPADRGEAVREAIANARDPENRVRLVISGTPEQIEKIRQYIIFTGATFEEE